MTKTVKVLDKLVEVAYDGREDLENHPYFLEGDYCPESGNAHDDFKEGLRIGRLELASELLDVVGGK